MTTAQMEATNFLNTAFDHNAKIVETAREFSSKLVADGFQQAHQHQAELQKLIHGCVKMSLQSFQQAQKLQLEAMQARLDTLQNQVDALGKN